MSIATAPVRLLGRWSDLSPSRRETLRQRGTLQALAPDLRTSVCRIIEDVRTQGDEGLLRALAEFDGCAIDQTRLRVSDEEFARARDNVDASCSPLSATAFPTSSVSMSGSPETANGIL